MTQIRDVVAEVLTWNPRKSDGSQTFTYIDLGAVDNISKEVTSPVAVRCSESPSRARQVVSAGDVLVSTVRPNLNAVAVVPPGLDGATASTGFTVLRPTARVDGRYLFHWVRSQTFVADMVRKATGASYPAVSDRIVKESKLPLPSLEEQRRIAAILDQADTLRAKRRQTLDLMGDLVQSIYFDMFGRADLPMLELGTALESAEVFTDGDWVESKDQDQEGEVRLTQLADVGDGVWVDKSSRFLTAKRAEELRCTYLSAGDVLIARMPDPLGRACLFPGDKRKCVTVVDVCVIRVDRSRFTPEWLVACLNSSQVRHQIARMATGTTRSRVSRGNLKKVRIPFVPVEDQQEFAHRLRAIDRVRTTMQPSAALEQALCDSIAQAAFAGSLRP